MRSARSANNKKVWIRLAVLWGIWYASMQSYFAPNYTSIIIWGGALLVGAATLPIFLRIFRWRQLSMEVKLLGVFWLWSLAGVLVVVEWEIFIRYSRLILQFTLIVLFVSFIIANSGARKPFLIGFVAAGVSLAYYAVSSLGLGFSLESMSSSDRVSGANMVGYGSVIGFLGILALYPETKAKLMRLMLILVGLFILYGVVLSASRGALVALLMVFALWPLFCFSSLFRSRLIAVGFVVVIGILGYLFYEFIMEDTNLGRRMQGLHDFEDSSTLARYELFILGFKIFLDYPLFGAGVGQFGVASGTGFYAHNELAELIGTTGLIGTLIYYSAYLVTWRRLAQCARVIHDPIVLYSINIARVMLLVLIVSGLLFRQNFLSPDSMFLYAYTVGISLWALRIQRSRYTSYRHKLHFPHVDSQ